MTSFAHVSQLVRTAHGYSPHVESRIVSDVLQALAAYPNLAPSVGTYTSNDGTSQRLVKIDGTIPFTYSGSTYYLPIQMWILVWYPTSPPVIYVVPTHSMAITSGHKHVDKSGVVYLPELARWDPNRSNIAHIIAIMTAVFSRDTPVYTQAPKTPTPAARQEPPTPIGQQEIVKILVERVKRRLRDKGEEAEIEAFAFRQDLENLQQTAEKLDGKLAGARFKYSEIDNVKSRHALLRKDMDDYDMEGGDIPLENAVVFETLKAQQVSCIANDHAIQNTIDCFVTAVGRRVISVDTFIRESYDLATEQYMERALYIEIKARKVRQKSQLASGTRQEMTT
jgi:UEV domain/Vps23 core domain